MPRKKGFFSRNRSDDDREPEEKKNQGEKYRRYLSEISLEEKRKLYLCRNSYVVLDDIPLWPAFYKLYFPRIQRMVQNKNPNNKNASYSCCIKEDINSKISLWQGDITKLEIDAIVNAANSSLKVGGGVDGAIHKAAGSTLLEECTTLKGCKTGQSKITSGHKLPAKFVIHTVGPRGYDPDFLESCYQTCFQLVLEHHIRSVAFCCISTGVYGFPQRAAAHIALKTTRKWMEKNIAKIDRVIFCTYLSKDFEIYQELMAQLYFPCNSSHDMTEETADSKDEDTVPKEMEEPVESETKVPCESDDFSNVTTPVELNFEAENNSISEQKLKNIKSMPVHAVDDGIQEKVLPSLTGSSLLPADRFMTNFNSARSGSGDLIDGPQLGRLILTTENSSQVLGGDSGIIDNLNANSVAMGGTDNNVLDFGTQESQ